MRNETQWFSITVLHGMSVVYEDVFLCRNMYHAQNLANYIAWTAARDVIHPMEYQYTRMNWLIHEVRAM